MAITPIAAGGPTVAEIADSSNDALEVGNFVMLFMVEKMANMVRRGSLRVAGLGTEMDKLKGLETDVDKGVLSSLTPEQPYNLFTGGTEAEARLELARFLEVGVELTRAGALENDKKLVDLKETPADSGKWDVFFLKKDGVELARNIRNAATDRTASNHDEQLSLQTVTGRFYILLERISNSVDSSEKQRGYAVQNLRR